MSTALNMLKTTSDFRRMDKQAQKFFAPAFVMQVLKTEEGAPFRLGLTVSRKVGNAVHRNRAKRRLREMVRTSASMPSGHDIVLIGRTGALNVDFAVMQADFEKGLKALGVRE